jgi:hypothetical protein
MTWFKVDDASPDHPKIKSLSDKAFRWWFNGLAYASRYLTNGRLPKVFWKQTPKGARQELSSNRLWDWDDPDFVIHDYLSHQSSKEDVEAEKQRNREKVAAYRERRREERRKQVLPVTEERRVTGNSTPNVTDPGYREVTGTENREQRTDTENREQRTTTTPPSRPLISGESNPRTWGKIHGEHVTGFCDWVCLPEFVFSEFCRKSGYSDKPDGGSDYVRGWAAAVRAKWTGPVGDNLKFWRSRWSESHPDTTTATPTKKPFSVAEALAREEARKTGRAS